MGTITDPFSGLIQGVLQGHAIATQLKNQAMQEEAFQRAQQRDADEQQLHFLTLQQQLENTGAQRVVPGSNAVQESFQATSPGAAPGMTDTSQTISNLRPVDKSRMISMRDPNTGQQAQWEVPTLQQRMDRELTMRRLEAEATGQAAAQSDIYKLQALQDYRDTHGVAIPAGHIAVRAGLAQAGERRLPTEMPGLIEAAQKILTPDYKEVQPGGTMMQMPRPSPFGTNAPMVSTMRDQQQTQQPDLSQIGVPAPVMPTIDTPGRPSFLPGNAVAPQAANPIAAAAAPYQQARAQFVADAKNAGQGTAPTTPAQTGAAPEGPRAIFTSPLKPTGDFQMVFLPAYARKLGYTGTDQEVVRQLKPDETMNAATVYAQKSKNPTELAIERSRLAMEQTRLRMEQRNQGVDAAGNAIQYKDAQGNPMNINADQRLVASYKMPPAQARSYATNPGFMEGVYALNPNFDYGKYEQRQKTLNDLTPGGTLGQNALALNTLVRHSDDMLNAISALGNKELTPLNPGINKFRELMGYSAPTNFNQLKQYVVGETVKLIRGGGGSEADEKRATDVLNRAASPTQLADAMKINFEVAGGKMQALNQSVRPMINDQTYTALDPGAASIMTRRGYNTETMRPRGAADSGHIIEIGGKRYQYKGTGATDNMNNYTEVPGGR